MTTSSHSADGLQAVRARAILYQHVREFFCQRQVLEVETPILQSVSHDENLTGMTVWLDRDTDATPDDHLLFLQYSPDLAMQQLLARGSESIYQICKVFRGSKPAHEQYRKYSPEFSMLAWYSPNIFVSQLMQDSQDLLAHVFGYAFDIEPISYEDAFVQRLDINPYQASLKQLKDLARRVGLTINYGEARLAWLNALFCNFVEPTLGYNQPVFLTHFAVQAASTAQTSIRDNRDVVTVKFDLYIDGLKLASGQALQAGQAIENQQHSLRHGRIFFGLDRLLMLLMDKRRIDQVVSFSSPMHQTT